MNRMTLMMNPRSRGGRARRVWPIFDDPACRRIVSSDPAELLDRAIADDAPVLVAVGGDGTINLALNAAMRRSPHPRLGVLYTGTSPDFCRFHGIPIQPREAWAILRRGRAEPVDLCRMTPLTAGGEGTPVWFGCGANLGLGPAVAAGANRLRPRLGDHLGTFLALMGALRRTRPFDARLSFEDGDPVFLKGLIHLAILKSDVVASGIRLGVPAAPADGFLHLVAVTRLRAGDLPRIYRGGLPKGAFVRRARSVTVETVPSLPFEYDGDPSPVHTPVRIACESRALEVIV